MAATVTVTKLTEKTETLLQGHVRSRNALFGAT